MKKLSYQSAKLNVQLETAKIKAWDWAEKLLAKKMPDFYRSVQSHLQGQRRKQLEKQWTEQEIKRSKDRDRDGKGKVGREFALELAQA